MKLVSFNKSDKANKKYTAVVESGEGRHKTIHFGDANMKDFTLFSASERDARKEAYLSRHKKNEDWSNPLTAGFWSRHILWGDTASVSKNLAITKRRYNL